MAVDIESLISSFERQTLSNLRSKVTELEAKVLLYDKWRLALNYCLANWNNGGTVALPTGGSKWYSGSELNSVVSTRDNYIKLWNDAKIQLEATKVEGDLYLENLVKKYGHVQSVAVSSFQSSIAKETTNKVIPIVVIVGLLLGFIAWRRNKKTKI